MEIYKGLAISSLTYRQNRKFSVMSNNKLAKLLSKDGIYGDVSIIEKKDFNGHLDFLTYLILSYGEEIRLRTDIVSSEGMRYNFLHIRSHKHSMNVSFEFYSGSHNSSIRIKYEFFREGPDLKGEEFYNHSLWTDDNRIDSQLSPIAIEIIEKTKELFKDGFFHY